ncbi:MAG: MBL fold metallo-hydrolase [Phycisphaerae bacterium]
MSIALTILGSGTSHGIPMIGCDCDVCMSDDPRDQRTRCSVIFHVDDKNVLIDTAPELRLQCLACNIRDVHAVCYTHHHADHVTGLDDLRRFNWLLGGPLPVYASRETIAHLTRMFTYAFAENRDYPSAIPTLHAHEISGPFEFCGRTITPIRYLHGKLPVLGFRIGRIAYLPDCSEIPEESLRHLHGLDVLVLDALRRRPHPTHFNLEQAIAMAEKIDADRTFFTHIAHELGHEATNRELPAGMQLAFDGLVIEES